MADSDGEYVADELSEDDIEEHHIEGVSHAHLVIGAVGARLSTGGIPTP